MEQFSTLHEKLFEISTLFKDSVAVRHRRTISAETKEKIAITELTYLDFSSLAQNISSSLIASGIHCDDKAAIILENRLEWGCIYFGILASGAIAIPLDAQASADDINFFLEDSAAKIIFTDAHALPKISDNLSKHPQIKQIVIFDDGSQYNEIQALLPTEIKTLTTSFNDFIKKAAVGSKPAFPARNTDDIASILYTSGTTGNYKGVMLTHGNLYSNYISVTKIANEHKNSPIYNQHFLAVLPLHHAFPFMATLLIPLFVGTKVTYLDSLKSTELLNCIKQDKITTLIGVPQLFHLLHQSLLAKIKTLPWHQKLLVSTMRQIVWYTRKFTNINFGNIAFASIHKAFGSQLRFLVSGGAKLNDAATKFFLQIGFEVIEGYGLTETSPIATFNFDKLHKLASAGKAIPDVSVDIVSTAADAKHASTENAASGEIIIRGPNVMKGYYQNAAETKEALKDGWFYTGDLGYLDKDGYLFITGRKKELIVLGSGKKIMPEEIEAYYSQNKFIKEICVTLIAQGNQEKLTAIIVPDLEYCKEVGKVDIFQTLHEEVGILSKELPPYKRILGFVVTSEPLPRTRLGKLRRFIIQEKYAAELHGKKKANGGFKKEGLANNSEDLELLSKPITNQIFAIIKQFSALNESIKLNDHLEIDLGLGSLARVELMVALEQALGIKLSEGEFSKIATVRELTLHINSVLSKSPIKNGTLLKVGETKIEQGKDVSLVWQDLLSNDLPPELKSKIVLHFNKWEKLEFSCLSNLGKLLMHLGWRLIIKGRENLTMDAPFILCANHTSFLDGIAVSLALPVQMRSKTFFIGLRNFFSGRILRKLIRLIKIIPIDPGTQLVPALQACAYVLRANQIACIFPEGGRSVDGKVQEFRKGIGILAKEMNMPIVPVHIKGAYEAWPRTQRFPNPHPITVTFGKAYKPQDLENIGNQLGATDAYDAIAKGIREKVIELDMNNEIKNIY